MSGPVQSPIPEPAALVSVVATVDYLHSTLTNLMQQRPDDCSKLSDPFSVPMLQLDGGGNLVFSYHSIY